MCPYFYIVFYFLLCLVGHTIAQMVSCHLSTTVAWIWGILFFILWGIFGGEIGIGTHFLWVLRFPLSLLIPPNTTYSVIIPPLTLYSLDTDSNIILSRTYVSGSRYFCWNLQKYTLKISVPFCSHLMQTNMTLRNGNRLDDSKCVQSR